MICVLILLVTLVRGCQCNADNSSSSPAWSAAAAAAAAAAEAEAARRSGGDADRALAAALRRQLMRDNYDYQNTHTDDDARTHTQHKQKDAGDNQRVLRANNEVDQPEEPEENEERKENQDDEEHEGQDVLEERHEPSDAPGSQDTSERRDRRERDREYDAPDAVDPADKQHVREPYDPVYDNVRDAIEPDRRDNTADRLAYDPIYYNKRSDAHHPGFALDEMQVAPVRHERARPDQPAPAADYSAAYDAHELRRPHVTRTNKLRPYEPRVHDHHPPPPRGHNISKKDLYYYVDDERLRRNNDVSADWSLTDTDYVNQAVEPSPGEGRRRVRHGKLRRDERSGGRGLAQRRPPRSQLVTVSASNVTYKLLTIKSREGRRSGSRRIVEERAAQGVALLSLDRAPVPALRLPRARRQYMHDQHSLQ